MRLIIEARLEGVERTSAMAAGAAVVAVVQRQDHSVADLGLSLAEGRALLAEVQSTLVLHQTAGWMSGQLACRRCGSVLAHKDSRSIVIRTVFGKVEVPSPRLWECSCAGKPRERRRSVSPLCKAVQRITPELEYLQAKWAAHLPYRQATELLQEVLRRSPQAALVAGSSPSAKHSTRRSSAILPLTQDPSQVIRFEHQPVSAVSASTRRG